MKKWVISMMVSLTLPSLMSAMNFGTSLAQLHCCAKQLQDKKKPRPQTPGKKETTQSKFKDYIDLAALRKKKLSDFHSSEEENLSDKE